MAKIWNQETAEFTYSCIRDIWKGIVVVIAVVIFHYAILLARVALAPWVADIMESIDSLWGIATVALVAFMFLAKLWVRGWKRH